MPVPGRREEPLHGDRELAHPGACRMEDGVDDGRGGAAHRQLAKALDAQRVGVAIGLPDEHDARCGPARHIRMDREAASTPGCSLPA
jgi:hypothetical protein